MATGTEDRPAEIRAESLPLEEKADRVFQALRGGDKLTRAELMERTGLSSAQVSQGWRYLRHQPDGHMWIVEPHRHKTLFYASAEAQPMLAYMLWQARHAYRRTVSLWSSARQLNYNLVQIREGNGLTATASTAMRSVADAQAGYKQLVRMFGSELGIADEAVEKMLAMPAESTQ